jgi:hypothetical protein
MYLTVIHKYEAKFSLWHFDKLSYCTYRILLTVLFKTANLLIILLGNQINLKSDRLVCRILIKNRFKSIENITKT